MKYVAVFKSDKGTGFPRECEEFDSEEEARAKHPDAKILTLEQYLIFHEEMGTRYPQPKKTHKAPKKKWWQFWRKA